MKNPADHGFYHYHFNNKNVMINTLKKVIDSKYSISLNMLHSDKKINKNAYYAEYI